MSPSKSRFKVGFIGLIGSFLFAVLLLLTGVFLVPGLYYKTKRCSLVTSSPAINLGKVKQYAFPRATFELKNEGSLLVRIVKITKSCGCTGITLSSFSVAPGKSVTVTAAISTKNKVGPFQTEIDIAWECDSEKSYSLPLTIKANIVSTATVSPDYLDLGIVKLSETTIPASLLIKKNGNSDSPWDHLEIKSDNFKFRCKSLDSNSFEVSAVEPRQFDVIGPHSEEITINLINSDNSVYGIIMVPLKVNFTSNVGAVPASLFLGVFSQSQPASGVVKIQGMADSKIKLISITSTNSQFTSALESQKQNELTLSYSVKGAIAKGPFSGQLLCEVLAPNKKKISIPFYGYCQ